MFNIQSYYEIIMPSLLTVLIVIFYFSIITKRFKTLFGECVSNNKTSLYHDPLLRGLGLIYLLPLIIIYEFTNISFLPGDIILIFTCTIIGFYDDKKGLSQKGKLIILSLVFIFFVYITFQNIENINDIYLETFLNYLYFIFLVLFFNQIDGINGLATITFIITLIFISLIGLIFISFLPIFICMFIYLFFNLRGKIGIQGEAGSFFMGSLIYVLYKNTFVNFEFIYILVFLGPVLIDITATTVIRFIYRENLLEGHRNNLYQILVAKYKNHILVSTCYGLFQIGIGTIIFTFINKLEANILVMLSLSISSFLFIIFFYLAYKIQNNNFYN